MSKEIFKALSLCAVGLAFVACSDDDDVIIANESDGKYVGTAQGNFASEEWFPGGELGTTNSIAANCYENETPAVAQQGFSDLFNEGDMIAAAKFTLSTSPYKGWGPVASRRSCEDCHSGGYSHGHSRNDFLPEHGNGYIVSVYTPDEPGSNDGKPIEQLTTFTMTMAVEPFLPPLDPAQVNIEWHEVERMESGLKMQFADGEAFSLRYPEVSIPPSAFNCVVQLSGSRFD